MTAQPVMLADCITLTKGKPPAEIPYFGDDAESYLSPEYLRGKSTAEPAKSAANAVRVVDGDTILLWDGSNAGEFFRGRNGLLSSTMIHIGHREDFEPDYFYYAAKRWEAYLKGQTSGSGIPHVDKEVLSKLEILQLAPGEQRLVAGILTNIDCAIEQTEAIIAKQQRIKTGLMQDLLTKGIDEHGNIRSEATHEFKDSPLGRIPVEWDIKSLENLSSDVVDCPHTTPHFSPEGNLVIRTFNIKDGQFCGDAYYVSEAEYKDRVSRLLPEVGDIVFTREAPVGEAFVIPQGMRLCLGQRTMLVRLRGEMLDPDYFVDTVYSKEMRVRFDWMVGGTTNPHLNVADVRRLTIKTPPVEEQQLISKTFRWIRAAMKKTQESKQKLEVTKQGVMHDLLTGKVRVTELLKQPAAQ